MLGLLWGGLPRAGAARAWRLLQRWSKLAAALDGFYFPLPLVRPPISPRLFFSVKAYFFATLPRSVL